LGFITLRIGLATLWIDGQLAVLGKKWVFVFDQINKLFVKPMNQNARDASGLAFPFFMIKQVLKPQRITSVIAASASNEMEYKESHEGFDEYHHITNMTGVELRMAFSDNIKSIEQLSEVLDYSGGVPLYAQKYAQAPAACQSEVTESISHGLDRLKRDSDMQVWNLVKESIFSSLLGTNSDSRKYDKKFTIRENSTNPIMPWRYQPLFPAVLSTYRNYFWDELMEYVDVHERHLLEVCISGDTENGTRGRLFETIVIRRCQGIGVTAQVGGDQVMIAPKTAVRFPGRLLPELKESSPDGVYVPIDPNFPAIDLVWKHGSIIV
jgi:hypothetical protein